MRTELRRFTAVMAMTLLTSAAASAQPAPDPRGERRAHLGPFYVTPSLTLKELGIDSNVFNNADEQSDFTFTLAPQVKVSLPFARRALLTTSAATDLVYYQKYSSERSLNPGVRVRGEVFVNRVTLFAEPSYLRTRQPLSIELDARAQREERSGKAGVGVRVTRTLALDLAARIDRVDFNADEVFAGTSLRETLNRESRTLSASVTQDVTPVTAIVFRAEGGVERFAWSPVRDADTLLVSSGVEFNPRALISGSASIGMRRFEPRSLRLEPFRGVVARAALEYATDSTRIGFAAERDVNYSFEPLQPYFVNQGFRVTAGRRLVGRADIEIGALRHDYAYRHLAIDAAAEAAAARVDTVRTWSASVGYRLAQTARLGVGMAYRSRRSNSAQYRDYEGIRLSATTTYGF